VHSQGELRSVDITTTPFTVTKLATGTIGAGVIGPDGCLYANAHDTILKLAPASGGCGFTPTNPSPALSLVLAAPSPTPQGTFATLTATLHNVSQPQGLPITFFVGGANPALKLVRADSNGQAVFNHQGVITGDDTVVARTSIDSSVVTSNRARISWTSGTHVTFLTLNPSPRGGTLGQPVLLRASLSDISADPAAPLPGASVTFTLDGQSCTATTDATGIAACLLTPDVAGLQTLAASFTPGTAEYVGYTTQTPFNVLLAPPPADSDGDGVTDDSDNCPLAANVDQANADGDALGDVCDGCPSDASPNCDESRTLQEVVVTRTIFTFCGRAGMASLSMLLAGLFFMKMSVVRRGRRQL
jgi:hypothetical protein